MAKGSMKPGFMMNQGAMKGAPKAAKGKKTNPFAAKKGAFGKKGGK